MGVTEIALFPLKAGLNAHDTSSPANRIWVEALNTVVSQPGARRAVYGMELENPTNFRLYVEWDKVEDHERFTKSAYVYPAPIHICSLSASCRILSLLSGQGANES